MEYVYATLTLNELGQELNEANITTVLEAAGADVVESRVKAIVAALEGVDLDELGLEAGIAPVAPPAEHDDADDSDESADEDARAIPAGTSGDAAEAESSADDAEDETEDQ